MATKVIRCGRAFRNNGPGVALIKAKVSLAEPESLTIQENSG